MTNVVARIAKRNAKTSIPEVRPGMVVRVAEESADLSAKALAAAGSTGRQGSRGQTSQGGKASVFEGIVIAVRHGKGISAAMTVRGMAGGQWIEKIYPLHSPVIKKIEVIKRGRVRRAKLAFIRDLKDFALRKKLRI